MSRNGLLDVEERVLAEDQRVEGHAQCPHLQFRTGIAEEERNGTGSRLMFNVGKNFRNN